MNNVTVTRSCGHEETMAYNGPILMPAVYKRYLKVNSTAVRCEACIKAAKEAK